MNIRLTVLVVVPALIIGGIVMASCSTKTGGNRQKYPAVEVVSHGSFMETLRMYKQFFLDGEARKPKEFLPQVRAEMGPLFGGGDQAADHQVKGELRSIWLGHSTLLLRVDGHTLLTDPVFEPSVSIVGPTRFNKQLPLDLKNVPELDAVLISHDHYDHLNRFTIRRLTSRTRLFVVPLGVGELLEKWGVPEEKIQELAWYQSVKLSPELTIWSTPAQHFSGRGLFDRNRRGWSSYAVVGPQHRLFFSGDSGYFDGFREIGEKFGPFDATFVECGAYNEHWANIHMFPEETVQAHIDLRGRVLNPIHWGTFDLALHPWQEPMERVMASGWERGVVLSTPVMGRVVDFDREIQPDPWWTRSVTETAGNPGELVMQ